VARIWGLTPQGFLLGHQFRCDSLLLFYSA
jgi:hypothetical protein